MVSKVVSSRDSLKQRYWLCLYCFIWSIGFIRNVLALSVCSFSVLLRFAVVLSLCWQMVSKSSFRSLSRNGNRPPLDDGKSPLVDLRHDDQMTRDRLASTRLTRVRNYYDGRTVFPNAAAMTGGRLSEDPPLAMWPNDRWAQQRVVITSLL